MPDLKSLIERAEQLLMRLGDMLPALHRGSRGGRVTRQFALNQAGRS